jgi:hypothetical protein
MFIALALKYESSFIVQEIYNYNVISTDRALNIFVTEF